MSPAGDRELPRLLAALCDGDLPPEQHARLEQLLATSPEHRRQYLEYVDLHARLLSHTLPGTGAAPPSAEGRAASPAPLPDPPAGESRPAPKVLRYALVVGATLAASLLLQVFWGHLST